MRWGLKLHETQSVIAGECNALNWNGLDEAKGFSIRIASNEIERLVLEHPFCPFRTLV